MKELVKYQEINFHIIFDIRMHFQQKAKFVAGVHNTKTPNSIRCYIVVSCDSICICLLLESLHGVEITDIYLESAYLNAPCVVKIWFVGGNKCVEYKGRGLLIVHALYFLKYSGFL